MKEEMNVTVAANTLGKAIEGTLKATGEALKDGWQTGTDLPMIITGSIMGFGAVASNAKDMGKEFKDSPIEATMGILIPISRGIKSLLVSLKEREDAKVITQE